MGTVASITLEVISDAIINEQRNVWQGRSEYEAELFKLIKLSDHSFKLYGCNFAIKMSPILLKSQRDQQANTKT